MPRARIAARYKEEKRCRSCGKTAQENRSICWICSEKQRKRKKKLKAEGLCTCCGRSEAILGKTRCITCATVDSNRFAERKASGICARCGKSDRIPGRTVCPACLDRHKKWKSVNKYGCAVEDAESWLLRCLSGVCAICGISAAESAKGTLFLDHSHTEPPKPRGCLCASCNPTLGHLEKVADLGGLIDRKVLSDNPFVRYLQTTDSRYAVDSQDRTC